ncbi:MAG: PqiC family protein [Desulfovibrio sp.]|jgi:uncharacterized lipoprotein YmbA|nr:PqiC family protein [Desulfovibrio sp.]
MVRPVFFFLFALFLLAACGRSVPDTYYLLESACAPLSVERLPGRSLRIARVSVPEYLDRSSIVSRIDDRAQLMVAQFHIWAEPLAQSVRRVVQEGLARLLLARGLTVQSPGDETAGDFTLFLDVQRLDGAVGGKAVLNVQWMLKNKRGAILGRGVYADEEQTSGNTYDAFVHAQSELVRRMTERLAQTLPLLIAEEKA